MPATTEDYSKIGKYLNDVLSMYNYQVTPLAPNGKPGKNIKSMREYRLQLIDKQRDTSESLIKSLPSVLKKNAGIQSVQFNKISPNSSKFPSVSFVFQDQKFDLVIGRGANRGENFETSTIADLASVFQAGKGSSDHLQLIKLLNDANKQFASVEIQSVKQRTGSTKKEGVPIDRLGAIIGDIILEDTTGYKWYVSLKDVNGKTFSSYSGASSLFNSLGELQPKSAGADFLTAFGVDLNKVQRGFDERNKKKDVRSNIALIRLNQTKLKAIFERAWGMNYFYVKKENIGWKVFWLDRNKLDKLTRNIRVTDIKYPNLSSKQITIMCENADQKYLVELRNSKAGEYPNDIKIKVR